MPLRAILFDMDGVLIISQPYSVRAIQEVLLEEGVVLSDDEFKKYLGTSIRDKLLAWERDYALRRLDPLLFALRVQAAESRLMADEIRPNHALQSFIVGARRAGVKVAVATSSERDRALRLLSLVGVAEMFDAMVTVEDCERHKPDPEVFLRAAAKLGVAPGDCVVIEDAEAGLEAARRGGMRRVAILSVYHPAPFPGIVSLSRVEELSLSLLEGLFSHDNASVRSPKSL